jgi:Fe(3+) dicitrate transport protein
MGSCFKNIIFSLTAALLCSAAAGQMSLIKGKVTDEKGEPLPGVAVIVRGLEQENGNVAVTNINGLYQVKAGRGKQLVIFQSLSFRTDADTIDVTGEVMELNKSLVASPLDMSMVEIIGGSEAAYRDLAGTATLLPTKTIQLVQPIGTQELLDRVPGILSATDDGMGNSRINVGIRGLSPTRSSHVLIMEDGVPVQPAAYIYPNAYYNPPVERIGQIEVIKGSASIKYGPQTMGGVINYITNKPRSTFGGRAMANAGNNNYYSAFAEVGGWGNDKLHPEVQLLYKSSDGYRENNHFEQMNATFKVNILPRARKSIYIKANVNYENSDATYTGLTEYSFRTNPRFNPKKHDNFEVLRTALDAIFVNEISDNLLSNSKVYFSYFDRDWWRENDVFVTEESFLKDTIVPVPWYTEGNLVRVGNGRDNYGNLRTFYNLGYERSYDIKHKLFGANANLEAGGRIHWERFLDHKKIGAAPDARDGVYYTTDTAGVVKIVGQAINYETTAFSAFLLEKITIGKVTITPGARVEAFEQESIDLLAGASYEDKTTIVVLPGMGFNWELKRMNIFGGVHRGFTPPSSGIIKTVGAINTTAKEKLDLKPEKSWNSEIGARASREEFTFEAAAFHLYIEDLVAAGRGTSFRNLGKAMTYGLEGMASLKFYNIFKKAGFLPEAYVSYTWLQTEVLEAEIPSALSTEIVSIAGKRLPNAPENVLVAGLMKEFGFGLALMAEARYVDQVFTDFENIIRTDNRGDQGVVPAYTIYNASAKYTFRKRWTATLTAKNLLDRVYIGSRLHSNPGQPEANLSSGILVGPRRQVNLSLRYEF